MIKLLPFVLKTVLRHRTRTLLTISGTAVGLFVFCFVGSVQQGIDDLLGRQEARQSLIVFQADKFCPATSRLPQDYDEKIAALPGVREVVPIQVFTNNCRASLDTVIFNGMPPEMLSRARNVRVTHGSQSEFEQHQDAALVGRAVAARRGLEVGDRFDMGDYTVNVVGIFACEDNRAEENYIFTHLDYLQRRRGQNQVGTVTQLEVLLDPGVDAEAKCREIDATLRGGSTQTQTRVKGVFQAKSLGDVMPLLTLSRYLGLASLGVVLMLVSTTTVMGVQDRLCEHAVMQTLGFSAPCVFRLVLTESVLIGAIGGAAGVAAAMITLASSNLAIGADAVTVSFTPSTEMAIAGLTIGASIGVAAGILPAWKAATTDIVNALRTQ